MRAFLLMFFLVAVYFTPFDASAQKAVAKSAQKVEEIKPPQEYTDFLRKLKKDMIKRGISQKTIDKAYAKSYYHPDPEVVKIDRKQAEFVMRSTDYLNRVVGEKRVKTAQTKYKELYPLFTDLEEKYGVSFEYLIAFWGIETNFGSTFGNYEVIDALTTMSYDKRRRKFFTEELYQALKIIDAYDIDPEQMEGSWAGAMGHFQFMPTTFNTYAVDYDGDGTIDIWHSFEDAVASAANYLSSIGWRKGEPWGTEVSVPWNFDYGLTGRTSTQTIKEWKELGIKTADGKELTFDDDIKASIILPEGKRGNIYLILPNFYRIMEWNRSESYALAVSQLADYIKTERKYKPFDCDPNIQVKTSDIQKVQAFINKLGLAKIDEDGQLGGKTKEAVKCLQKEAKLPADGYPDYRLLQKINSYNKDIGFAIPVQPTKAEYKSKKK